MYLGDCVVDLTTEHCITSSTTVSADSNQSGWIRSIIQHFDPNGDHEDWDHWPAAVFVD
jgi:hypothetical protein